VLGILMYLYAHSGACAPCSSNASSLATISDACITCSPTEYPWAFASNFVNHEYLRGLDAGALPRHEVVMREVEGRVGKLAVAGDAL